MGQEKIIVNIDPDLEDLIPGFLENRSKDVDKLRGAFTENDIDSLQSIGHSLKGVGGGYGFDGLSAIGAEIESTAKAKDLERMGALIDELADYLNRIEVNFE